MEEFIKHFKHNSSGSWTCITKAEVNGPNGRIQVTAGSRFTRGTNFMGIDLAKWLDDEFKKSQRKASRP